MDTTSYWRGLNALNALLSGYSGPIRIRSDRHSRLHRRLVHHANLARHPTHRAVDSSQIAPGSNGHHIEKRGTLHGSLYTCSGRGNFVSYPCWRGSPEPLAWYSSACGCPFKKGLALGKMADRGRSNRDSVNT